MKKILSIVAFATLAMAFVSCEKDDETPTEVEVKKLPSKVSASFLSEPENDMFYRYDDQNRLICAIRGRDTIDISYNADNTPQKWGLRVQNGYLDSAQYDGNQVSIYHRGGLLPNTTLLLNDNKQIVKYGRSPNFQYFDFDQNGSLIRSHYNNDTAYYTPSNVQTAWRHVNTPEWLLFALVNQTAVYKKMGYMDEKYISSTETTLFSYELDMDGYPTEMEGITKKNGAITDTNWLTFEYIPAK